MNINDCYNFEDFRKLAKKKLPAPIFHYIDGGADDEVTLNRNTNAFNDCDLVPNILASVGGVQPDRQEFTVKGSKASRKVAEFYKDSVSTGDPFTPLRNETDDPRAVSLKAQLDNLVLKLNYKPNSLASIDEALRVQILVEEILSKT